MKLTRNFNLSEFACHDEHNTPVPEKYMCNVIQLANQLQLLRDELGETITVNSGYRTAKYNAKLTGSAKNSQHLTASAADITVRSKSPKQLKALIEQAIKDGKVQFGGIGLYPGFVHVDIRKEKARW